MNNKFSDLINNKWIQLTLVTRIFSAVYILFDPFWGSIFYLIFDWTDSQFMLRFAHVSRITYHQWDKILDWLGYIAMFIVSYRLGFLHLTLVILFLLRLLGQFVFQATHNVRYFIIFPDLFSFVFYWIIAFMKFGKPIVFYNSVYWTWISILFVIKMTQEIYLHYIWNRFMVKKGLDYIPLGFWKNKLGI